MPPSLPTPTLSDQSGLWACGQREDALPTGPTGATTGDYMIEKCQPCNRSTLSAMYPVEPESDLSPHAGREPAPDLIRGRIPSAVQRSNGIPVRGRSRESELVDKPPHPICFASQGLRSQIDLSPHAGRGGASGARVATSKQRAICDSPAARGERWNKWLWRRHASLRSAGMTAEVHAALPAPCTAQVALRAKEIRPRSPAAHLDDAADDAADIEGAAGHGPWAAPPHPPAFPLTSSTARIYFTIILYTCPDNPQVRHGRSRRTYCNTNGNGVRRAGPGGSAGSYPGTGGSAAAGQERDRQKPGTVHQP